MDAENTGLFRLPFACEREVRSSAHYRWDNRHRESDPFVILQYTMEGEGRFQYHEERHRLASGHAFIAIPPEKSVYEYPESERRPWVFSWVNFYGDFSVRLWRELRERSGPVIALGPRAHRALASLIREVSKKGARKDVYELSILAYRFYLEVIRSVPQKPSAGRLQGVIEYLRSHYRESLGVKELAVHAGLSREHFSRLFMQEFGVSPAAYLRQMRLKAASNLLLTTSLPVKEIAFRSGFACATKFGISFKSLHKLTPEQFRKKRRK